VVIKLQLLKVLFCYLTCGPF